MRQRLLAAAFVTAITQCSGTALAADAPDEIDMRLCRLLAATNSVADLVVLEAYFDIDGDDTIEQLGNQYMGTAIVQYQTIFHEDGSEADLSGPGIIFDRDFPYGIPGQRWMIYANRVYTLSFANRGTHYLYYLGRIATVGGGKFEERPVCQYRPMPPNEYFTALLPEDQPICDAVAAGKVAYSPVQAMRQAIEGRMVFEAKTFITARTTVDFANNRKPTDLYLLQADSNANVGCSIGYYDTRPDDRSSIAHRQLMALQQVDLDAPYPALCSNPDPRWLTYKGVTYLETRSGYGRIPASEEDEYHYVDAIRPGFPTRVCEARYSRSAPELTNIWNGNGWSPPF